MQKKKQKAGFVMVPVKIFTLGLDSYSRDAFVALRSFGNKHGRNIYPGWSKISALTGMSRDRVWRSLVQLRNCRVITWDTGKPGRSNEYSVNPESLWISRGGAVDKSEQPVCQEDSTRLPERLVPVCQKDSTRLPNRHQLDPLTRSPELDPITIPLRGIDWKAWGDRMKSKEGKSHE